MPRAWRGAPYPTDASTLSAAPSYHTLSAATTSPDYKCRYERLWRWHTFGEPYPGWTATRNLPDVVQTHVTSVTFHDAAFVIILPETVLGGAFPLKETGFRLERFPKFDPLRSPDPLTRYVRRTTLGPSSLERGSPQNAIIQHVEDATFNAAFLERHREALGQIAKLAHLSAGWDTYDASPVSEDARNDAVTLLAACCSGDVPSPMVHASPSGGVLLQWELAGKEIEVEIAPDMLTFFTQSVADGAMREYLEFAPTDLPALAKRLAASFQ